MAEEDLAQHGPDSAPTPPPKKKRRVSLARMMRPDPAFEAAMKGHNSLSAHFRQIEAETAPLRAAMRNATEFRWQIDAAFAYEEDEDQPQPSAAVSAASRPAEPAAAPASPAAVTPPKPKRSEPPATADAAIPDGWAIYERRDSPAWLVDRIREWWPPFHPGAVGHWFRLEKEIKNLRHELGTDERPPSEFEQERLRWAPEDLVAYMEEIRMIPRRKRGPRGPTVCERLRKLHAEEPHFAETAPERKLAQRVGLKSPGSLTKSEYWQTVLQPLRAKVRAQAHLAKAGKQSNAANPSKSQARSDNWDQRAAVDGIADRMDAVEILDRRLLELHREEPAFAETAAEETVAQRVSVPSECLSMSPYWRLTLQPRRDELRARARESEIDGGH